MITTESIAALLRGECKPPENGVIGLVDELLDCCRAGPFRLTWVPNLVTLQPIQSGTKQDITVILRHSVLRAVIARLAALASRGLSTSVNPYEGSGSISVPKFPDTTFLIQFVNNEDEQRLEVTPVLNRLAFALAFS